MGSGVAGALRGQTGDRREHPGRDPERPRSRRRPRRGVARDAGARVWVAGFELRDGTRIICEEIAAFDPGSLEEVRFVAYSDEEYQTVQTVADEVRE